MTLSSTNIQPLPNMKLVDSEINSETEAEFYITQQSKRAAYIVDRFLELTTIRIHYQFLFCK